MPSSDPLVLTADDRQRTKEWVDRNPLRAWRHSQNPKMPILDTAQMLGVGMSMVQMYEKGAHRPGPKSEEAMTRLLGSDWHKQWDRWLASRPA